MYKVDDMVVYGNQGVCQIVNIGNLSISMADRKKKYYTLRPIYKREAVVYVPVDNIKAVMRPVMTKEEALELIHKIPSIEHAWIINEAERELQYKTALKTCDCEELVKIIKALFKRKQTRIEDGKKVTVVDERYLNQAENQLYEELAYALDMPKDEVYPFIKKTITTDMNN